MQEYKLPAFCKVKKKLLAKTTTTSILASLVKIYIHKIINVIQGGIMRKQILLLVLILLTISIAWAATYTENFDVNGNWEGGSMTGYNAKTYVNSSDPSNDGFSSNSAIRETTNTYSSGYAWRLNSGAYYLRYECAVTVTGFSVYLARWDNDPSPSITIRYSTDSGSNYTNIETITGAWFTADLAYKKYTYTFSPSISPSSGNKIYIELNKTTGERLLVDDFELVYTAAVSPTISVSPASLPNFTYVQGSGPSTEQSFTISGTNLTGDISIAATTNYEISTGSGTSFSATNPIVLTASKLAVTNTTIYVRLKAGLTSGTYNSENITASSSGATNKTVSCSGSVTAPSYIPISLGNTATESFSIGTSATATLPNGWKADKIDSGVRTIGSYTSAVTATTQRAGNSMSSSASNGIYNYGAGVADAATERAVGFLSSSSATQSGNLYAKIKNTGAAQIPSFKISYDVEKYRNGSNSAGFSIQMYYSTDGTSWTSAGSHFLTSYSADLDNNGYTSAPGATASVTNKTIPANLNSGSDFYLAWNYSVTSETTTTNAQALGIDNVSIEAVTLEQVIVPVISPVSGTYYANQSVTISCATVGATIYYTTDGNDPTTSSTPYSGEFQVTQTTTVKAFAVKDGMADSAIATADYVLPIPVANIAALRAGTTGTTLYKLTGEAILTFQQTFRNQKYIQDSTAGILIDDVSNLLLTSYNNGDGITGICGTLTLFGGMLQFVPETTGPAASSSGNSITPQDVSLATLVSNFEDYESELVKVRNVTFDTTGTFSNGTLYQMNSGTMGFYTTFYDVDYIGTSIPTGKVDIIGIPNSRIIEGNLFTARKLSDFSVTYDYPDGEAVIEEDGNTVTIVGGSANRGTAVTPGGLNSSFTPTATYVFDLLGAGGWDIIIQTADLWGACYYGGNWHVGQNAEGQIVFNVPASKDINDVVVVLGDQDPTLPVELSSFTATLTAHNTVSVMWVTQSETNVNGYYVYRGMSSELEEAATVSPLIPATNTSQQQMYQFTDSEVFDAGTYYYWLQVQDLDGSIQFHGPTTVFFDNGGNGTPVIPKVTELKSVYPNPFNPSTTISYSLAKASTVDFVIYNNRGQIVRSFNEGNKGIGNHSFNWFGDDQNGRACSTGVYYIKMQAGKDSFIRKAVLMK